MLTSSASAGGPQVPCPLASRENGVQTEIVIGCPASAEEKDLHRSWERSLLPVLLQEEGQDQNSVNNKAVKLPLSC